MHFVFYKQDISCFSRYYYDGQALSRIFYLTSQLHNLYYHTFVVLDYFSMMFDFNNTIAKSVCFYSLSTLYQSIEF
jgi:hypothetical protein